MKDTKEFKEKETENIKKEFREKPYCLFVAKYTSTQTWLPYYAHAMDTAGIMLKLLNHWLPGHIVDRISEKNPKIELDKLVLFLGLNHDVGKMIPVFQAKICDNIPYLRERIVSEGIEIKAFSEYIAKNGTPHSYAGEAILLENGCPEGVASVIGSHHGTPFPDYKDVMSNMRNCEENFYGRAGKSSSQGKLWRSIWERWIHFTLSYSGYESIDQIPEIDVPTQVVLSGLLMMADWIASNETYTPFLLLEDSDTELEYPDRIEQIWNNLSFPDQWIPSCWFMDEDAFEAQYGFWPNVMQRKMLQAVEEATTPGIYILEAQMGFGKTEAALSAAEVLASKWHCEGIYFGLPTQATANGIFPRLKTWAQNQSEDVQLSIKLAHGMATLQKGYRELFHGQAEQNEDEKNGLIVHRWFEGRKQALLSSFVVGTVDQLLMAALQQKHFMLRHLGLAGKVVIIDECHAYDSYMSCYLERVLEWLGIYEVPVILLSATLPAQRRVKLVEAYHGRAFNEESEGWRDNEVYPLLTYTDGECVRQQIIPVNASSKTIKIIRGDVNQIEDILKEKLAEGGCAGVIVNTVTQAQEIAHELREKMPDYTVLLVHARFTIEDRQQAEEELLERLGKFSGIEKRNLIVVGTQILEQSLDIDFDILITQLAPMDLLLQRIGRLHRHGQRIRPDRLQEPVCMVCGCEELDEGSKQIYGEWILARTVQLLPEKIDLPKDISPLVQEAYRDQKEGEKLFPLWEMHMDSQRKKVENAASHQIFSQKELEETMHGFLDERVGDRDSDAQARVRDSEPSLTVLLMVQLDEESVGFVPWQSQGERIACNHMPSEEECYKILRQQVQLPRQLSVYKYEECTAQLESQNIAFLGEWQKSRLLKGELVLLLSNDLKAELCGYILSYDRKYGLICRKEE